MDDLSQRNFSLWDVGVHGPARNSSIASDPSETNRLGCHALALQCGRFKIAKCAMETMAFASAPLLDSSSIGVGDVTAACSILAHHRRWPAYLNRDIARRFLFHAGAKR